MIDKWTSGSCKVVVTGGAGFIGANLARRLTILPWVTRISLLELVSVLEGVLARPLTMLHEPARPGDVRDSQADRTRLEKLFPDITPIPLAEGLRATAVWMHDNSRSPTSGRSANAP